jgi:CrcB protein
MVASPSPSEPVDPDVDLHVPAQRRESRSQRAVLAVIAVGGMVGASARHGCELAWPTPSGGLPWATFTINASGCLLIGVLMVFVVEVGGAHPLVRPFLGVGLLGGFTTFSTYTVEATGLLTGDRPGLAIGYLFGTVLAALVAVATGVVSARAGVRVGEHARRRRHERMRGHSR